jgi:hypothetical protein
MSVSPSRKQNSQRHLGQNSRGAMRLIEPRLPRPAFPMNTEEVKPEHPFVPNHQLLPGTGSAM